MIVNDDSDRDLPMGSGFLMCVESNGQERDGGRIVFHAGVLSMDSGPGREQ